MDDVSRRLEGLSLEDKRALAAELLARRRQETDIPVSLGQRALWFVHQLDRSSAAYNVAAQWRVDAAVVPDVLRAALQALSDRHAALRTVFAGVDGEPVQRVRPRADVEFDVVDATVDPALDVAALLSAAAHRPFALDLAPPWRACLVKRGERDYILQLTFHHIVYDLRSGVQITRELPVLYDAALRGQGAASLPTATQFGDYVRWQRALLAGDEGERQWRFWQQQLEGQTPVLNLPTDYPRQAVQTYPGRSLSFAMPDGLTAQIRLLARRCGTTPNTVLLAAWYALLYRYSGQQDISVGSPWWGRSGQFDEVIGYFVNPLVLRVQVTSDLPFSSLIRSVAHTVLQAMEHSDFPFPLLVERLQRHHDASRSPLFQVAFTWNKLGLLEATPVAETGLPLQFAGGAQQGANFDLELAVAERQDGLGGWWRYNTDLYHDDTIAAMAGHYVRLLEAAVEAPDTKVAHLPLVDAAERARLLSAWNGDGPAATHHPVRTLVQWFEAQVASTPDAPAATCDVDTLTYRELNARANRLAAYLRARGVAAECRVGLCVERSLSLVVGILGVLKAGGAYVPIDPAYPADRARFMLADSRASVVVTEEGLRHLVDSGEVTVVSVDGDAAAIDREHDEGPAADVPVDALAYVIYTSGSTGQPKGVGVTHANVVRLFETTAPWFGFGPTDVWTLFHSSAFDFSVWELWGALLYGGRVVVVPFWVSRSPEAFRRLLESERVTVLNQTPSAFQQLSEADGSSETGPLRLRYVIFGGEALELSSLRGWIARHGAEVPRLINMYGITETTVHVTYRPLTAADITAGGGSVIGQPLPDLRLFILDEQLEPAPVGVPGELYVGGRGVARGYLNQAALTASRFVPDAFTEAPGARLYRTGDVARRLRDGDVEYLGRIDQQVKIRGFRIELGEIVQALRTHPAVADVAVVVDGVTAGDARLVAYVVPDLVLAAPLRRVLSWEAAGRLHDVEWAELPNGLTVAHLNRNETDFLFQEIFADGQYFKHGIALEPGACVLDVGANIGLFSLYVASHVPDVRIHAFEPIPPVFERLRLNAELYGVDLRAHACGLSSDEGTATFTYYPKMSIFSGRFADAGEEEEVVKAFLRNQADAEAASPQLLDELLRERLVTETVTCPLATVSSVIRAEGIERIDLLKVDVEKSELAVLEGVDDGDWQKIRQVIVEVHDQDGRLAAVTALLERHGFTLAVEQDAAMAGTGLHSVYASRAPVGATMPPMRIPAWSSRSAFVAELRSHLRRSLPEYMVPASFVLLPALPLTNNGKLDRQALPSATVQTSRHVAPRTPLEAQLLEIWREVLNVDAIGVTDNLFDLGGHSLLVTRLVSRIRTATSVDLPLRTLFEHPTIEDVALAIVQQQAADVDPEALAQALAEIEGS